MDAGGYAGKENRKPKPLVAKRGGGSLTMDSLVASLADVSMTRGDGSDDAAAAAAAAKKLSIGSGVVVNVHRRRSGNNGPRAMMDSSLLSTDETTYSIADIDNSLVGRGSKANPGRIRGRGKRNHTVSSLVQTKETEQKCGRNSGVSSLMTLTSSIQKTQKSSRSKRDKWKSSRSSGQTSILNDERGNVTSLTDYVGSLTMGDTADCSTPLTIRHRAMPGGIASPPGFLHRLSTLSNGNNIFDRSPMPDSNPNLKKRVDGKKTPDQKLIALATVKSPPTSPFSLVTKMSTSPYVFDDKSAHTQVDEARDYTGHAAPSPRVLVSSSSYISSPNNECNSLSRARSMLLYSNDDTQEADVLGLMSAAAMEVATPRLRKQDFEVGTSPSAPPRAPVRGTAVFDVEVAVPVVRNENDAITAQRRNGHAKKAAYKDTSTRTVANKKVAVRPRVTVKEVIDDDKVTGVRKSSRQSKPTDRFTVTSFVNEDNNNTDGKARFDSSVDADVSVDESVDEAAIHPPPVEKVSGAMERAGTTKEVKGGDLASKRISESPASNDNTVQARSSTADGSATGHEWSCDELRILRHCQKGIDPTSNLYWQEVANRVGTKTSYECQMKWQSLVPTPQVRKASKKKNAIPKGGEVNASVSDDDEDEDDLFNSSPYREANLEDGEEPNARMFTSVGTSTSLTPYIKQSTKSNDPSALKFRRKGYNSYIDNLRKDIRRAEKKKKASLPKHISSDRSHISVGIEIGGSQMSGKLLPDGTVKINMLDESSDDDIWAEVDDDEE
ncbi:hypothetical protein ACHAW5_000157 [Stephanodiscus triporus]|uniref:Myb-like domain-containing protein n=1 Tax=Stephanodiscus triporus TaxID=2934178 RepID=A0ABD3NYC4_9STRA